MRPIELTIRHVPGWAHAITLWPVIFYEPHVRQDPCIQAHERYHWRDQLRWGVLPWFAAYLVLAVIYLGQPADCHPMERRAYEIERECRRKRNA